MTRITLATIKSFIKKNEGKLYIEQQSRFDGMVDCIMPTNSNGLVPAQKDERGFENTMGICGAWFVLCGGDWYREYYSGNFSGYEVSNCCGSFIIATK